MLREQDLKLTYDSDQDDILRDFYIPALSAASNYWRMSAYFSASSLFVASAGFTKLLENNGHVRLILGNELSIQIIKLAKMAITRERLLRALSIILVTQSPRYQVTFFIKG